MKSRSTLKRRYGVDEYGFDLIFGKYSGTRISRELNGSMMGCSYCFPHGHETVNSHYVNLQRSWKKHRKTQWRTV